MKNVTIIILAFLAGFIPMSGLLMALMCGGIERPVREGGMTLGIASFLIGAILLCVVVTLIVRKVAKWQIIFLPLVGAVAAWVILFFGPDYSKLILGACKPYPQA